MTLDSRQKSDRVPSLRGAVKKLTADEFTFAITAGAAACTGRYALESLETRLRPVDIVDDDTGEVLQTVRLTDIPLNRANIAVMDALSHDVDAAVAATFRIHMVLGPCTEHPEAVARGWVRKSGDGFEVAECLVMACATLPVNFGFKRDPVTRALRLAAKLEEGAS